MHPAFSVIFFTTLSGAGYGLAAWIAFALLLTPERSISFAPHAAALALAFVLITVGLLSSLAHLGKPQRAWRALSQWRSSWLSREGIVALLTYAPLLTVLVWLLIDFSWSLMARVACLLALALGALTTVVCTAMIYASLKPVPAWRHPLVVPGYLGFALVTGGLLAGSFLAYPSRPLPSITLACAMIAVVALAIVKLTYWRSIDSDKDMPARSSFVGLPQGSKVTAWEAPNTEANYLTREMGYVLARRHRTRLRQGAVLLFAVMPLLLLVASWLLPSMQNPLFASAALSCLLGAMVERWLFFAEAKHMVSLYYG